MPFSLQDSLLILERTPALLSLQLSGLPEQWLRATEGPGTWSPFDVAGHLLHGEKTDWRVRISRILEHGESLAFETFDRTAMFRDSQGRSIDELLADFARLRAENLDFLRGLDLQEEQLGLCGLHPQLGRVSMRQLLATWTAHDLAHLLQINRVLARQYREEVGPWRQYLSVMQPL
ncbi:DinB family protein [bacterium]|nr:DinB family protein [bacterium]